MTTSGYLQDCLLQSVLDLPVRRCFWEFEEAEARRISFWLHCQHWGTCENQARPLFAKFSRNLSQPSCSDSFLCSDL